MKVKAKQLAEVLVKACDGKTDKQVESIVKEFAGWLEGRGERHRAREIIQAMDNAWKQTYGAANITIGTAYPLDKTLRAAIVKAANGASITEQVDQSLIGGARLRVDDRLIDGSVAGKLEALRHALNA